MRIHYITTALFLVITSSNLFCSDETLDRGTTASSPGPAAVRTLPAFQRSSVEDWILYLSQEDPQGPVTTKDLTQAMETFKNHGMLADWIARVGKQISGPPSLSNPTYVAHLVSTVKVIAPRELLSMEALAELFPDYKALPNAIWSYLTLINKCLAGQSAAQQAEQNMLMTKYTLMAAFETLSKHYIDRITQTKGFLTRDEAFDITEIMLAAYHSPFIIELARRSGWDRMLLDVVAARTPDLSPYEKDYIKGFIHLAKVESYGDKFPEAEARKIVKQFGSTLSCEVDDQTSKSHAMWAFPLLASAYHALGQKDDCLKTWEEFDKLYPANHPWCHRDMINALYHICHFSDDPRVIKHWWDRYQKQTSFNMGRFLPTDLELNMITNVNDGFSRLKCHEESMFLSQKILNFFGNEGKSLLDGRLSEHYATHHFLTSLSLARSLTELGRYQEAVAIYETFFEWDQYNIYLKAGCDVTRTEKDELEDALGEDLRCAATALSQTGRLTQADPKAKLQQARKGKAANRQGTRSGVRRTAKSSARHSLSIANGAKAHLVAHYTQRLKRMGEKLEDTAKRSQGLHLSEEFAQTVVAYQSKIHALKKELANVSSAPLKKNDGGAPTINEVGQRVDTLWASFDVLERTLEPAESERKSQRQREFEEYLRHLSADEGDTLHFTPIASPEPAQVPARKKKTKGVAKPAAAAPKKAAQQPAPAKVALLMKKKADVDYQSLMPNMQRKFHRLAAEIAQNPYQILGGLGRPERLVSGEGLYFSRRLSDGDRVVYQLIKDESDAVSVVFLSLLGHYENLSRHQESTHVHPLVLQKSTKEKSS